MKSLPVLMLYFLFISGNVQSDSYYLPPGIHEKSYNFGALELIRVVDNRSFGPLYSVKALYNGELVSDIKGLTFESVIPFAGGYYILGISNLKNSAVAYFVMRSDGLIISIAPHNSDIEYCGRSISRYRRWFNVDDYDLKEVKGKSGLPDLVSIKNCSGNRVEIYKR